MGLGLDSFAYGLAGVYTALGVWALLQGARIHYFSKPMTLQKAFHAVILAVAAGTHRLAAVPPVVFLPRSPACCCDSIIFCVQLWSTVRSSPKPRNVRTVWLALCGVFVCSTRGFLLSSAVIWRRLLLCSNANRQNFGLHPDSTPRLAVLFRVHVSADFVVRLRVTVTTLLFGCHPDSPDLHREFCAFGGAGLISTTRPMINAR
jgi:hypothetical protein